MRLLRALFWIGMILYASTSDAKPKSPADVGFKGWWSVPLSRTGGHVYLKVHGVVVDSLNLPAIDDSKYVCVLFIARRDTSGGNHGDRSTKAH